MSNERSVTLVAQAKALLPQMQEAADRLRSLLAEYQAIRTHLYRLRDGKYAECFPGTGDLTFAVAPSLADIEAAVAALEGAT